MSFRAEIFVYFMLNLSICVPFGSKLGFNFTLTGEEGGGMMESFRNRLFFREMARFYDAISAHIFKQQGK